jgi:ribonuclease G
MGAKGARVTTQFTLPSRYLVFTPQSLRITVSQRITDEAVRERLLRMLAPSTQGGYIFRTAAVMASPAEIEADKEFLQALWTEILTRSRYAKTGELVYAELPLMLRVLRDWVTDEVTRVRVDQPRAAEEMKEFARQYMPKLVGRIEYHAPPQPIFDIDSIEEQLQKTLHRKVYLKSGGHLIFDQTEAMTTIDVNSGSYPGGGSHEETIFKINSEAVDVIAWQIRLRNLGGIIVVDFIDMMDPAHKEKLLELLTAAVAKDSVRTEVSELSTLGLVQMTRKRTRESLERILCAPCPLCKRRGSVKSLETMCYEILRELQQTARHFAWPGFQVIAAEPVVNYFLSQEPALLSDLERQIGKPMTLRVGPLYGQEQYDILPAS